MEATYYNDSMRSYMIIPCPPEAETEGYQYRMLEMNRIEGLLSCGLRNIDGERYLYYDITGKQSLQGLYESRKIAGTEMFGLLADMERVTKSLAGYLLDEQHLVLTKEQVFYDFGTGSYCFTYYPGAVAAPEVFRFIADGIDGADKQAAAAAYRLASMEGGDRLALREAVRREVAQKDDPDPFEEEDKSPFALAAEESAFERGEEEPETSWNNRDPARARDIREQERPREERIREAREPERTREKRLFRRKKADDPYVRETAQTLPPAESRTDAPSRGKKQTALRILLILVLLGGAGGLIAVPFLLYVSDRERRLCTAGAILLLAAGGLLTAELILKARRNREEDAGNRQPLYSVSDEKDMPLFDPDGKAGYRLREEADNTVRFSGSETIGRLYGRERGNRIDLRTLPVTVGKAPAYADHVLADPSISRVHARIYKGEDGCIEIRDLNSTNGTWINGVRLEPNEKARVRRGDEVRFGSVEYEYR